MSKQVCLTIVLKNFLLSGCSPASWNDPKTEMYFRHTARVAWTLELSRTSLSVAFETITMRYRLPEHLHRSRLFRKLPRRFLTYLCFKCLDATKKTICINTSCWFRPVALPGLRNDSDAYVSHLQYSVDAHSSTFLSWRIISYVFGVCLQRTSNCNAKLPTAMLWISFCRFCMTVWFEGVPKDVNVRRGTCLIRTTQQTRSAYCLNSVAVLIPTATPTDVSHLLFSVCFAKKSAVE